MLQEILLCLAGHHSPFLQETRGWDSKARIPSGQKPYEQKNPALSPPERALLSTAAHLGDLHNKIKNHATSISASHSSIVCRAVASNVVCTQLNKFMAQILATERSILAKDSSYVGEYGIVPLSALIGDFAPWTRPLEWLWDAVCYMQPRTGVEGGGQSAQSCTGSSAIDFLRKESHTGYADLKAMALELIAEAELVWLQQLSTWVLYGRPPTFGYSDFFVQTIPSELPIDKLEISDLYIHHDLQPDFVSPATASSILVIVQSLNQIRVQDQDVPLPISSADPALKLLPAHLKYLKTIDSPISSSALTSAIASIRESISRNALTRLLPLSRIIEVLHVLQDFLLLRRGEFAVSLISNADKKLSTRDHDRGPAKMVRNAPHNLALKDGGPEAILSQTWSELVALQSEDLLDGTLDNGRELLRMVAKGHQPRAEGHQTDFSSLVFAVPSSLILSFTSMSPLALFLSRADISLYAEVNSYLLGIRRASMHLESLWRLTGLRRSSTGLSLNPNAAADVQRLVNRRIRDNKRRERLRLTWATASKARLVLMELGAYLQGRIVHGHSQHFLDWVLGMVETEDISSKSPQLAESMAVESNLPCAQGMSDVPEEAKPSQLSGIINTSRCSETEQTPQRSSVATLAEAHRIYLAALRSSLLLDATEFTKSLFDLLRALDHFVALVERFHAAQRNLDLEGEEGTSRNGADHSSREGELFKEVERSRKTIEGQLVGLVEALRMSVDGEGEAESRDNIINRVEEMDITTSSSYTPWRVPSADSLLMKLEFVGNESQRETTEEEHGYNSH